MLPLGPVGYGGSPYQSPSSFAGNPLLISLDRLADRGWIDARELSRVPEFPANRVDYDAVATLKWEWLRSAFRRFAASGGDPGFEVFRRNHGDWLDDYALYQALRDAHDGRPWYEWEPDIRSRQPDALKRWRDRVAEGVRFHEFVQYAFDLQWRELRESCQARGIRLIGDIPIFVAHDSADVWANRSLFDLAPDGEPNYVAGVPPDYFSATGQLWGNPIYRWKAMEETGFQWWVERFRATFDMVDIVRLDHFRGFEAYWRVPGGDKTAVNGQWIKAPGERLFEAVEEALGPLPIVAENLGVITPEVEAMRERFGFPGMSVLQFAFGNDPQGPSFRPHNYPVHRFAYTGTHDNDTTIGWWTSTGPGGSTRSDADLEKERAFCCAYLNTDGKEMNWDFIRAVMASVACTAVAPMQDLLGLGSEARMNLPGEPSGHWRWRCPESAFHPALSRRLRTLIELYDR